ncbi:hypothetical protein QL285_084567 [Trifolium repens]|nr:hypothetical protein QL285_084567 [Trifolium repens]
MSGLKVNFWKSGLIGINVLTPFMEMTCTFLNCRLGLLPFKYLGLPIGANAKSPSTWDPLLQHLRNRLLSWENKHISLDGRIVLINSVLNAIPIFFLSFMKMPMSVWKKVVKIQHQFLWGGVRGGKKISWVKWEVVCKEKSQGGFGVRDIRLVNLSLLSKWRWRLLQPGKVCPFGRRFSLQNMVILLLTLWIGEIEEFRSLPPLGGRIFVLWMVW